jgi:peptide/nickel transport system permease protein
MTALVDIAVAAPSFLGEMEELPRPSAWHRLSRTWLNKPLGLLGLVIIFVLVTLGVGAPLFQRYEPDQPFQVRNPNYDPNSTDFYSNSGEEYILDTLSPPSWKHWFGTDDAARDTWSRIVWGARRTLEISIVSLLIGVAIGTVLGIISGYFGGGFDTLFQRILDAMQAFPPLLILILAATAFELNVRNITLVFAFIAIPQVSRLVRGNTLALREIPFIEAARVIGAGDRRIMFRHVLPNSWATIIVVYTIGIGTVIVAEAAITFLALAAPAISWGLMLSYGVNDIKSGGAWLCLFAGGAITLAVLAFNLLGDALRDILDPRLRI